MARSRVPVRRAARSTKVWLAPAEQGFVAVANNTKALLASTGGFGLGSSGTIIRSRGELITRPTATTADVDYSGAFGIAVVSQTAEATGITAIPGPWSDADWSGWFVHQMVGAALDFQSGVGVQLVHDRWTIDSRAMRKVPGDTAIVLVGESQSGAISFMSHIRILFQES